MYSNVFTRLVLLNIVSDIVDQTSDSLSRNDTTIRPGENTN